MAPESYRSQQGRNFQGGEEIKYDREKVHLLERINRKIRENQGHKIPSNSEYTTWPGGATVKNNLPTRLTYQPTILVDW